MINRFGLYDDIIQKSSCGVGFITRKDSKQTHELLKKVMKFYALFLTEEVCHPKEQEMEREYLLIYQENSLVK